ncbi:MAG: hypothetical protein IPJ34_35435 [Myxococcales bacterium]|nr:hypothetical protein [Myxococcales bacterium]
MGPGKRALLLAVVPLVAGWELLAAERQHRAVPTDSDWRAAAAAALAAKKPGDMVIVAPRWAEPLGRKAGFELTGLASDKPLFDLRMAGRSDLETVPRVLELSIRGKDDPQVKGFRLVSEQAFGTVKLRTFDNPRPEKLLRDLVSEVDATATVSRVAPDGASEPCRWETEGSQHIPNLFAGPVPPKKRWSCPPFDPGWSWVGETAITDLDYVPRRCVLMHPTLSNTTIAFPPRPIGQKVVAYVGKHVYVEREKRLSPVHVRISVAGKEVAHAFQRDGDGWLRFEGSTAAWAGSSQPVKIELWAEGSPQFRVACVAAELRE